MGHSLKRIQLLISLSMAGLSACGNGADPNSPLGSGLGEGQKQPPKTTRAEFKEFPVTFSFDYAGDARRVFDVQACFETCQSYIKVDCTKSGCELIDGTTGEPRTNFKMKSSLVNGGLTLEWTDLAFETLGRGLNRVEIRSSGISTIEAVRNNSLQNVE